MPPNRPRWSSTIRLTIILLVLALIIYLLYRFNVVIKPFILAGILAYVLTPMANWLQRRLRLPRGLAALFSFLALLLPGAAILAVLLPPLAEQAANLDLNVQRFINTAETFLGKAYIIAGWRIDLDTLFHQLVNLVRGGVIQPIFAQTLTILFDVISSFVWVIFIGVVSFYLVKDAPVLGQWLEKTIPEDYRADYNLIRQEIVQIWSAFFRGQLVLALIVAVGFTIVGLLIGLPFVLPMALLAGLLEFLPSVGHGIWLFIASILAFFAGSSWLPIPNWVFMLIVIGLHLFFEQFDLNYLIPRVIGRRVRLPPLVVILGIVAGAVLAGVLGILVAAPTIASARVLGRYIFANLTDQDPFPDLGAIALPPPNPRWWRKKGGAVSSESDLKP